jgi:hypothetical protein
MMEQPERQSHYFGGGVCASRWNEAFQGRLVAGHVSEDWSSRGTAILRGSKHFGISVFEGLACWQIQHSLDQAMAKVRGCHRLGRGRCEF